MIQIGRFQLDPQMRTLSGAAGRVHIGGRAFDILACLAASRGRPVTKDELLRHVWPDTIVEENNLQVHLSTLRKALGTDRNLIVTLPGRGYQLARQSAHAAQTPESQNANPSSSLQRISGDLPEHAGELFGRDIAIQEIAALVPRTRAVTLVGAGGIGKTCLASAVARRIAEQFDDGVYFASLAAHSDPATVLNAVADACGLVFAAGTASAALVATALAGRQCLLVLDNAEHVIDVVADLTEALTRVNPELRVLTTSREPLRAIAESVYRVQPLAVPASHAQCHDVRGHAAVRMFLQRVRALQPAFGDDAASVALVGDVCRRLDGIPLAIELAAARAATLGIGGLHRRLDDRLNMLTGGRRTAPPRHRTLRATFDWSYALLDPATRTVFRRLAQFAGTFRIEEACALAADSEIAPTHVMTSAIELAEKSLLEVEFEGTSTRYRLLESTRAYAREKLREEGEEPGIASAQMRALAARFAPEMRALESYLSAEPVEQ
jgi:predicted ATPase/DNA-binding winged helix-turn-helix (wHTH) protein